MHHLPAHSGTEIRARTHVQPYRQEVDRLTAHHHRQAGVHARGQCGGAPLLFDAECEDAIAAL